MIKINVSDMRVIVAMQYALGMGARDLAGVVERYDGHKDAELRDALLEANAAVRTALEKLHAIPIDRAAR